MSDFELIEDTSGNYEVHEDGEYLNCYGTMDEASDYITAHAEQDDWVYLIYNNGEKEQASIDDLGSWCYQ